MTLYPLVVPPPFRLLALPPVLLLVLSACGQPPVEAPPSPPTVLPATPSASPTPTPPSSPSATPTPTPTASPTPPPRDPRYLGTLTPYGVPDRTANTGPIGFQVVFTENVSRHGSRSLTTKSDSKRALALWSKATKAKALTASGAQFGPAVKTLTTSMAKVGYGQLSTLGAQELRGIGQREGRRLQPYFAQAAKSGDSVAVFNSGVRRTKESGDNFVTGLRSEATNLKVSAPQVDEKTLKYSDTDPAYARFLKQDKTWRAAYQKALDPINVEATSIQGLQRLYTPAFVAKISNPVAEAQSIWDLYRVAPGLGADVQVDMKPFMDPATAKAFDFEDDDEYFYSRGPGITGTDQSYRASGVLLQDFLRRADERLGGGSVAAVYRFSHDQEVAPFAALLDLPGNQQLPSADTVFSWSNSDYEVSQVASLASNISWTLWRNPAGVVLLQVRKNERPVALGRSCRAESKKVTGSGAGPFYTWTEVKRCLGDL